MNGPAVCAVLLLMILIVIFSIPLAYRASIHIGSPFCFSWKIRWLGHGFYYEWDYEAGKIPKKKCYIRWRDYYRDKRYEEWLSKNVIKEIGTEEELRWKELSAEKPVTYDDLKDKVTFAELRQRWKEEFWWWPLVMNTAFGKALASLLLNLLFHSRIRRFYLAGFIGLPQSYETGLLSALLYATIPANISRLSFNYTEEEYNLRGYANGRMYPAVLLLHLAAFALAQPVRPLWHYWFKKRKDEDHGQQLHKK